jgi:hypothetical protein
MIPTRALFSSISCVRCDHRNDSSQQCVHDQRARTSVRNPQSDEAPPLPQPRQRVQNGAGSREVKANDILDGHICPNICAMKIDIGNIAFIDNTAFPSTAPVGSIKIDKDL